MLRSTTPRSSPFCKRSSSPLLPTSCSTDSHWLRSYEGLQDNIRHTFANSSSPGILAAASNIFRIAVQDPTRALSPRGSASTLSTYDEASTHGAGRNHLMALDELGMAGLAAPLQFLPPGSGQGTKMINWISELVLEIVGDVADVRLPPSLRPFHLIPQLTSSPPTEMGRLHRRHPHQRHHLLPRSLRLPLLRRPTKAPRRIQSHRRPRRGRRRAPHAPGRGHPGESRRDAD